MLDSPSDAAPTGAAWSASQRVAAAGQMQFDPAFYLSRAAPLPIVEWPSWAVWLSVVVLVGAVVTAC